MKNYLPRLRTRKDIVAYFKATDKNSAISEYLLKVLTKQNQITSKVVGNKVLVNLLVKNKIMAEKHSYRMRFAYAILQEFSSYDADTRLRKAGIRSIVNKNKIHSFTLPDSKCLIDLDSFISFFGNENILGKIQHVPRLLYYESCYHLLNSEFPKISMTWEQLHDIVHSGEIFVFKHGKRFIVNYDELLDKLK